jgi:hypothetical protein
VTIGGGGRWLVSPGSCQTTPGRIRSNVQVPNGVTRGDDVPLSATMPDDNTDTATLAITGN